MVTKLTKAVIVSMLLAGCQGATEAQSDGQPDSKLAVEADVKGAVKKAPKKVRNSKPRAPTPSGGWPAQAPPMSTVLVMPTGDTGFYTPPTKAGLQVTLTAAADGISDDSAKLKKAIKKASAAGGGTVLVPKGTYVFSGIKILSNVRIEIEAGTIITPIKSNTKGGGKKKNTKPASITIFEFGKHGGKVENVSIVGKDGSYTVNLHAYEPGIAVFSMNNVENFRISNAIINDKLTKFSAITMGPSGFEAPGRGMPTNGYVSDITQTGAHYGYGVVQTQAAKNVLFENLHGEGGAVVRMETGARGVNDMQYGGLANVIAKNTSCKDGNAAVMISPHAMHNGVVFADGVKSDGCGFAVRIGNGYIAKKYTNPNLESGTYSEGTRVTNIHAKFGENAQLKRKHYKYMPEALLGQISTQSEDGESNRGPSIAPVLNIANYPMQVSNVRSEGFSGTPDIAVQSALRQK